MRVHGISAVVTCSLLCACATTDLSEMEYPIDNADLDILGTQQELEFETSMATPLAAAGVVGLLIAGTMHDVKKDRAAEAIAPIHDYLAEYDLSDQFIKRIQAANITGQLVKGAEPIVWEPPGPPQDREIDRTLITIDPRVRLSNDMRILLVDLEVWEATPRDGYTTPKREFSQAYRFLWPLPDSDGLDRKEAATAWTDRPRERLVSLIETGMDETVRMLETHLEQQTLVFDDPEEIVRIPASGRYYLWQEHEDSAWVAKKSGRGIIYAVPDHAIEVGSQSRQIRQTSR